MNAYLRENGAQEDDLVKIYTDGEARLRVSLTKLRQGNDGRASPPIQQRRSQSKPPIPPRGIGGNAAAEREPLSTLEGTICKGTPSAEGRPPQLPRGTTPGTGTGAGEQPPGAAVGMAGHEEEVEEEGEEAVALQGDATFKSRKNCHVRREEKLLAGLCNPLSLRVPRHVLC